MNFDYDDIEGIKKNKQGNQYVSNPYLLKEMIKSKEKGELTQEALKMIYLIAENLTRKKFFKLPEDREDCIQTAMLDALLYWQSFDPEKSNNPFAYFTSLLTNGLAKGWKKIYGKFKSSEMTSLDNNIHSF